MATESSNKPFVAERVNEFVNKALAKLNLGQHGFILRQKGK
jgi:hypothetical protein